MTVSAPHSTQVNQRHTWQGEDLHRNDLIAKVILIVGYGNQGRPQALNLKDQGFNVTIALRPDSPLRHTAEADGFSVVTVEEGAKTADVVMFLIPDEAIPRAFEQWRHAAPHGGRGRYVGFAHGLAVTAKWLTLPHDSGINTFLVAPKAQGRGVRNKFLQHSGVPALVAVGEDPSGNTRDIALGYAAGLGCGRTAIFETTFSEETECDLFTEQVLLCGGLTGLIKAAYETLLEAGYSPDTAWFECVFEVKLLADLIHEKGITGMREAISPAARFGDVTQGPRVIDGHVKETMRHILDEIRSGQFMAELKEDADSGYPRCHGLVEAERHHPVEAATRQILPLVHPAS